MKVSPSHSASDPCVVRKLGDRNQGFKIKGTGGLWARIKAKRLHKQQVQLQIQRPSP